MAVVEEIHYFDDLTGGPADEVDIEFSIDGTTYFIDLKAENAHRLRDDVFGPYIEKARRGRGRRTPQRDPHLIPELREWAKHVGVKVCPRGRIPIFVWDAFLADYYGQNSNA